MIAAVCIALVSALLVGEAALCWQWARREMRWLTIEPVFLRWQSWVRRAISQPWPGYNGLQYFETAALLPEMKVERLGDEIVISGLDQALRDAVHRAIARAPAGSA
ncbi:hypothetical protein [Ferrovibrio xuzhouensis]|uniref:PH domain-containing protein n=1 Tax=Ferrovibrio xuzhouensis TaxID=1576914 RepID=A0ABV7VET1_9PROT